MKQYLQNMNKKYEALIQGLKISEKMMVDLSDKKTIIDQINKKNKNGGTDTSGKKKVEKQTSVAEYFQEYLDKNI